MAHTNSKQDRKTRQEEGCFGPLITHFSTQTRLACVSMDQDQMVHVQERRQLLVTCELVELSSLYLAGSQFRRQSWD